MPAAVPRALRAAALLLALLLAPGLPPAAGPAGPDAPLSVSSGPVTVLHAPENAGLAREIARRAERQHARIRRELGLERSVDVTLLLLTARSPEETREEWARRLPPWIAGAARASESFAVVRVRPGQIPRDLDALVAHELAHVVLKSDYPGMDGWPLWFREGLAMRASGGEGWRRFTTLSIAALRDRLIPMERLWTSFPADEAGARLAYAQSFSFIGHLAGGANRRRFDDLMQGLRSRPFEEAFESAYGTGVDAAERLWRRGVVRRSGWISAATSGTAFWMLATLLFLGVLWARRRKDRRIRERWDAEEQAERDPREPPWGPLH